MFNLIHIKKFYYFTLKRRMPTCYLLTSKSLLTIAVLLFVYFITMDIILFGKARARGPFRTFSNSPASIITNKTQPAMNNNKILSVFAPLPVKKIMMAEVTHFIRSPLAELVEYAFGFSELFPFVGANVISFTHCVLSVISIKYLTHDSLFWRQFGVCLFQFRNFLDSFDGVIYRAHAKKMTYKSYYGSLGYFVDAFSDVFGGICLIGSIAIYFVKRPPPNKNLTRCFKLADDINDCESNLSSNSSSSNCLYSANTSSNEKSSSHASRTYYNQINSQDKMSMYKENSNSSVFATKPVVLVTIALIGIRLALSALFWDRSVHAYEDLLDCMPKSELHQDLQVQVLRSVITLFIMFAWRIFCALSLQDMLLTAIFIDKTWEFIVKSQYIGWILLICLIILTELHVTEVRSILTKTTL